MKPKTEEEPTRYLLTGGGTAGHVYPALAFAEHIAEKDPSARFLYVGTRKGAEERIVPEWGLPLKTMNVRGLPARKDPIEYVGFFVLLILSTMKAVGVLLRFRPHAIIATGGYASAPIFLAALLMRLPGFWKGVLALHEQNIVPGRFNLFMSRWADFIGASFPETLACFPRHKTIWTGYPIRKDVAGIHTEDTARKRQERQALGIPPSAKVILVFGGSSGARTINEALLRSLPRLLERENVYIFHATGHPQGSPDPEEEIRILPVEPRCLEAMKQRYRHEPYFNHLESCYRVADLAVSRSGAGSVWEIASVQVPALLIPKAGLPGDHQVKNARFLERYGHARLLYEKVIPSEPGVAAGTGVDSDEFVREIFSLLEETAIEGNRTRMQVPSGTDRFYDVLQNFIACVPPFETMARFGPDPSSVQARNRPPVLMEWLPAPKLLSVLDEKYRRGKPICETDKRYLTSKISFLLNSSRWESRNLGVKLVGLIRDFDSLPFLLHFIRDRTPASCLHRILGGDYREVGFVRRNALQALWRLHIYDARVREALIEALSDPYFEVRSWAARGIARLSDLIGEDVELEAHLRRNLRDKWFEVVAFSLEPLGKISKDPEILSDLVPLLEDRNWKVQEAAVQCLIQLLQRDIIHLRKDTEDRMKRIPMRGQDFFPRFPLQKTWEDFLRLRSKNSVSDETSHPD